MSRLPVVDFRAMDKLLRYLGFQVVRQKGSNSGRIYSSRLNSGFGLCGTYNKKRATHLIACVARRT